MSAITIRPMLPFSLRWLGVLALVFASVGLLAQANPAPQEKVKEFGICADCHEDVCTDFKLVRHAEIKSERWTKTALQVETVCANCHGDPAKHLEAGGGVGTIFAFRSTDEAQAKAEKCLQCHSATRSLFFASPHGQAAMDCTICHSELMRTPEERRRPSEVCLTCHEDIGAHFKMNERHRLQEGVLECTTCHDQHAPSTRTRLGGFKDEQCIRCHTDKGGPFLYEHEASQVEGCTSCHEVHGSNNRHMLTHQSTADLCFSCHAEAPSWHGFFTSQDTNCVTCHATIHGSNLSKRFLK